MNEQTIQILTTLAAKLGTTMDHLWSVLLVQVYIDSIVGLLLSIFFCVAYVYIMKFSYQKFTTPKQGDIYPEWDHDFVPALIMFGVIGGIFLIPFTVFSIANFITMIFNPEYLALTEITSLIK